MISAARASFNAPCFLEYCFGLFSSSAIKSRIFGRNFLESSPPWAAIVFATFGWSLTVHGRSAGTAVAFDFSLGCLVDGFKDGSCVEELVVSGIEPRGDFAIIQAILASWNEELGNGDTEGIGNALHDLHSDIGGRSLNFGKRWGEKSLLARQVVLGRDGPSPVR